MSLFGQDEFLKTIYLSFRPFDNKSIPFLSRKSFSIDFPCQGKEISKESSVMGIQVPKNYFLKKGFRGFSGYKISKSEASKNGFFPDCSPT